MPAVIKNFKTKVKTPVGKIIAGGILLIILSAAALVIIYWNQIKKGLIHEKVKGTVAEKTDNLYDFTFDDLEMDEVSGNLTVSNIQLTYDSSRYQVLKQLNKAPSTIFKITIPQLIVRNVQTPKALLDKELTGGKLQISRPVIHIQYTNEGEEASQRIPTDEIYKQILGDLTLIHLDTLLITDAQIITSDFKSGKKQLEAGHLWLQLKDIAIDSSANKDSSRLMFAKSLELTCPVIEWKAKNKLYDFKIDSLHLLSEANRIEVYSFKVIPLLGETAFAAKKKVAADRFDISLNNIEIKNIHFPQLAKQIIEADNITINNASVKIYRENNRQQDGKNRIGTYPQQRVAQIPIPVNIREFILHNTYVEYKEKGKIVEKTGKVIFSNLEGRFKNITNIKNNIRANNQLTAQVNARFLKKFPVSTQWTFYLANPKGRFDVSGKAGQMDAATLNQVAVPLGGARIEKGKVQSLDFDFKADNYSTTGTVKFLYRDLKLAILERDEETDDLKKKKLASLGANVIIKNNNPGSNGKIRVADINYDRDTTRSMFNMAWKALREGLKKTALPD